MNIYINLLVEFLLISSSILFLFKLRKILGLAPLYIVLGAVQYIQALSGTMISFEVFGEYTLYPSSVILFSAVLFAVLLIYIKEGVSSARALIIGIIISNFILSALFEINYQQEVITGNNQNLVALSVFLINYKYFITGTIILLLDFIFLVIIYQFLISKINKLPFFLIIFSSLFSVLIFDAFAFNIGLKYDSPDLTNSLISHVIGKSFSALIFSVILYVYLKFIDNDKKQTEFIANQNRDVFSILSLRQKYLDLKVEKKQIERKLTSQLEDTLNNISDGFVSLDTNWCYTYVNIKAGEVLGRTPESLIGKHIWTEFPGGVGLPFYKAYNQASETQKTVYFEEYYEPFDSWFENRIYPSPDGLTIYFTDITEQKKAEEYNQTLLSLIETSEDFIGLATLEGKPIYLNRSGREIIGLENGVEMPESISSFFPDDYQETVANDPLPEIIQHGKWKGEIQFQNFKTGALIPIDMSGFMIKDPITNQPIAIGNVARDISVKKQNEEHIIKSEKLFRGLSANAPVAIFQTDIDGSCNYVNEEWMKYSGMPFEDAMGFGWTNAIHPDDKERVRNEVERAVAAGTESILEYRFQNLKKQTTWLSTKTVELHDAQNKLYGYIGIAIDITERKKAQEQIIKNEKYLNNIINSIGDPVFVKDEQSNMLLLNDAFCKVFNMSRVNMIGKTLAEDLPLDEMEGFLRIDKHVLNTGIENINEETLTVKGQKTRIISTKKTRFIDDSGNKYLIGTIRDITEQKRVEEEIRAANQRITTVLNNSPVAIIEWDKNSIVLNWSVQAKNIFGWDETEAIGKHLSDLNLIYEEDAVAIAINADELINGKVKNNRLVNRNYTKTNKIIYCEWYNSILKSADGQIDTIFSLVQNITDRKKNEEVIKESEEKFSNAFRSNVMGLAILNKDSKIIEINDAFLQTLETTRDEIVGKTSVESGLYNFIEEDQFESGETIWTRLRAEGHIQNVEVSTTLASGKKLFLLLSMEPIDMLDEPHILLTSNNITERKNAEEGQIHLTNIIEQSLNEIYIFDTDTWLFEYVNTGAIKNIGYSMEEMANMTPLDIKSDFTEAKWIELLEPLKSTETDKLEFETRHFRKDKSSYPVEIHLQRIEQQDKSVYLAVILDITERKITEVELIKYRHHLEDLVELRTSELEKEKVKAQSADLMKSAFLATMSHELRTPMNSIIGFTSILLKEYPGPLNEEQAKQLAMVKNSGQHLLGLINDILDISKIEAGELKVSLSKFNYLNTIASTIDFLSPQASKKGLKISTEISKTDITLKSDQRRVEQILLNLISNAIKFSQKGSILIKVNVKNNILITQVIDEGIGISNEGLNRLFMPFIQLDRGLSRNQEGTGLGLAISKNLIEKLGGTIQVASELGNGSTFTFTLPLE